MCICERSFKLFSENSNCTEGIYTQYDVSSRSCDCPPACTQVLFAVSGKDVPDESLVKWRLTLHKILSIDFEIETRNNLPSINWGVSIISIFSDILILNLPTKNYKSPNNKRYQQKTTNLPTIKLSQTKIKEKLQIYQQ